MQTRAGEKGDFANYQPNFLFRPLAAPSRFIRKTTLMPGERAAIDLGVQSEQEKTTPIRSGIESNRIRRECGACRCNRLAKSLPVIPPEGSAGKKGPEGQISQTGVLVRTIGGFLCQFCSSDVSVVLSGCLRHTHPLNIAKSLWQLLHGKVDFQTAIRRRWFYLNIPH